MTVCVRLIFCVGDVWTDCGMFLDRLWDVLAFRLGGFRHNPSSCSDVGCDAVRGARTHRLSTSGSRQQDSSCFVTIGSMGLYSTTKLPTNGLLCVFYSSSRESRPEVSLIKRHTCSIRFPFVHSSRVFTGSGFVFQKGILFALAG